MYLKAASMEINRFNKLPLCLPSAFVNKLEYTDRNVKLLDTQSPHAKPGTGERPYRIPVSLFPVPVLGCR